MTQAYPKIPVLTKKEIELTKKKIELEREQNNTPDQDSKTLLQDLSWLEVHMLNEFNYTGAVMRNHARQGLLHSFLRHCVQWANVIPKLDEDIQNLSIGHDLDEIGAASQPKVAANLLNQFFKKLMEELSDDDREALSDIQMRIYNFLNRNITYSSYLGEGINNDGRMQVFFKVVDNLGNEQVMVVCVSEQLYPPNRDFVDRRPVRTITTIFFITLQEALERRLIPKTF